MLKMSLKFTILMISIIYLSACNKTNCNSAADFDAKSKEFKKGLNKIKDKGQQRELGKLFKKIIKLEKSKDYQGACELMDEILDDL